MCEVPSWASDKDGQRFFVRDKDVIAYCNSHRKTIEWNDWTGHTGITRMFDACRYKGEGFTECPDDILQALRNGEMDNIAAHGCNADDYPRWLMNRMAKHVAAGRLAGPLITLLAGSSLRRESRP